MDITAAPIPEAGTPAATLCARALAIRRSDPRAALALAEEAAAGAAPGTEHRRALATLGACLAAESAGLLRGREVLAEALVLAAEAGDDWLRSEVLNELAAGYVSTKEFGLALEHAEEALRIGRRLGRGAEVARSLRLLGSAYTDSGDFDRALALLLEALRVHESVAGERPAPLDDTAHWERGTLFGRIGIVYSNLDQFEQALSYYRVALDSFRDRFPARAARTLYRMGIAAEEMGDIDGAEAFYRESLELYGRHGDRQGRAVSLLGVGHALRMRGEHARAEAALVEGMREIEHDPVHRAYYVDGLWMLAELHLERGDAAEALVLLERALPLYDADRRAPSHQAALRERISRAHAMLGDPEQALEHFRAFHRFTVQHLEERATSRLAEMMARFDTERALKEGELSRLRSEALEREVAERRVVEAELARAKAELEARNRELHALSIRDPLTGLYNRRHLDARLGEAFELARRKEQPLSVMICDIDDFKRINDRFSHAVGDRVLRAVAGILRDQLRRSDVAARFGGEEFVVLFPSAGRDEAAGACEKVRARVEAFPWSEIHRGLAVTISAGIASAEGHANHEKMLSEADRRLYEAKGRGKNRVEG